MKTEGTGKCGFTRLVPTLLPGTGAAEGLRGAWWKVPGLPALRWHSAVQRMPGKRAWLTMAQAGRSKSSRP